MTYEIKDDRCTRCKLSVETCQSQIEFWHKFYCKIRHVKYVPLNVKICCMDVEGLEKETGLKISQ